jgi:hypothetical protein
LSANHNTPQKITFLKKIARFETNCAPGGKLSAADSVLYCHAGLDA